MGRDVGVEPGAGAQLRIPVRIAQIAHVEHQVGMAGQAAREAEAHYVERGLVILCIGEALADFLLQVVAAVIGRSEEHTSELQSLMRISYAVFCLKKTKLT